MLDNQIDYDSATYLDYKIASKIDEIKRRDGSLLVTENGKRVYLDPTSVRVYKQWAKRTKEDLKSFEDEILKLSPRRDFSYDDDESIRNIYIGLANEIVDLKNEAISSYSDAIYEQSVQNYLNSKLLEGYPENGGKCYVSVDEACEAAEEDEVAYKIFDSLDTIVDRLNDKREELAVKDLEIQAKIKEFGLFAITNDLRGGQFIVEAIDLKTAKENGAKWVVRKMMKDKLYKVFDREKLELAVKEWLDEA